MVIIPKSKSRPCQIEAVGLISSFPYQRLIKCATELYQHYPKKYLKPKFRGMLEFDWDEYLTKQRRMFGGQLWALLRPVAVYMNEEFIGSDEDLVEVVNKSFVYSMPGSAAFYHQAMVDDYKRYLSKTQRIYVYLDINIEMEHVGLLIFQLYSDLLPRTSYNFRSLCTGNENEILSYKGTQIHRSAKMGWLQGGDNENITGGGGKSIYGATFADESYCISHDRRGVLSMANDGKHSNGSQFVVTLQPTLWMDYYYVAFGQLVEGVDVLKAIESVDERYEEPKKRIKIVDCGVVFEPMSKEHWKRIEPCQSRDMREKIRQERRARKTIQELYSRTSSDLDLPHWREPVIDPRDLDSYMHVDRYLKGLYYLFDRPERKESVKSEPADDIKEPAADDVQSDDVGQYILAEIFKRLNSSTSLDENSERMAFKIICDIVSKATIFKEVVDTASALVDNVIEEAIAAVLASLEENDSTQSDDSPRSSTDQTDSVRIADNVKYPVEVIYNDEGGDSQGETGEVENRTDGPDSEQQMSDSEQQPATDTEELVTDTEEPGASAEEDAPLEESPEES